MIGKETRKLVNQLVNSCPTDHKDWCFSAEKEIDKELIDLAVSLEGCVLPEILESYCEITNLIDMVHDFTYPSLNLEPEKTIEEWEKKTQSQDIYIRLLDGFRDDLVNSLVSNCNCKKWEASA